MAESEPALVELDDRADDLLRVRLSGRWNLESSVPSSEPVLRALESGVVTRVVFDGSGVASWDSTLVAFVHSVQRAASKRQAAVDVAMLPEGARRLLGLSAAVRPRDQPVQVEDDAVTARVGRVALHAAGTVSDALSFTGETALALLALVQGRARFRGVDLWRALEAAGVGALGIVALVNFLIGAVLAFVGAVQLSQFGATIYVADLVGIGVTRELGALMTGIVMAGRTGASYAAVLGTMNVNEETDALRTMGIKPAEFLVMPRLLATSLMLPALTAYADLLGILGGMFVGVALLDLSTLQFLGQLQGSLALRHVVIGLVKGGAFGVVVALTGCYYGVRCGRSAAAVGEATTKAVVMGIVMVVVVDAVFTALLHVLGL